MTQSATHLTIPLVANGPDGSGNGGWSAGLLAEHVRDSGGGIAVNLRLPPPIGRPLRVQRTPDGVVQLLDDDAAADAPAVVATAETAHVDVDVPAEVRSVTPQRAEAASSGFPFRDAHPFPRCVACGTDRAPDEIALELHCGPVAGVTVLDELGEPSAVYADAWTPTANVADPAVPELVTLEACWSALDCPSAAPFADPAAELPSVLARIAVRIDRLPRVGEPHVLAAWRLGVDGRKQRSASALLNASGEVLAVAQALWIVVRAR